GQGLCVRCNHTKQLPGWIARTLAPPNAAPITPPIAAPLDPPGRSRDPGPRHPGLRHTVETTTPTGHRYTSTAPPLLPALVPAAAPGTTTTDPECPDSPLERALALALAA
ncbi:hypothetical protein ACFQU3_16875, partial [Terrabacter sp. GCM10028922]